MKVMTSIDPTSDNRTQKRFFPSNDVTIEVNSRPQGVDRLDGIPNRNYSKYRQQENPDWIRVV